jgi:hypothetical protein
LPRPAARSPQPAAPLQEKEAHEPITMAFHTTRELIDGLAYRNPIFADVRDIGDVAELLEVLWWLSDDGEDNAGQQLIWRGRQGGAPIDDPTAPVTTLRYRRLCPLWHLRREGEEEAAPPPAPEPSALPPYDLSMGPEPPAPYVYSGARILVDGTHFPAVGKTAEEIVISRVARPPPGSPVVGNAADSLRAAAVYDDTPSPTAPFEQPEGKTILYTVVAAHGRWNNATNVIVQFGPPFAGRQAPREVIILRGARPYHHGNPVGYSNT